MSTSNSLTKMASTEKEQLALDCVGLDFAFVTGGENVLEGINLQLGKGARCLLVGANGGEPVCCNAESSR
jgi:ABC-type transport system involved in cytochrome bd biosynthesis fused ATPase/permease subunit